MNERELAAWLAAHGGEVARTNNEKTYPAPPPGANPFDETAQKAGKTYIDSTTITARDGAKIEIRRQVPEGVDTGEDLPADVPGPRAQAYQVVGTTPPRVTSERTPTQQSSDEADLAEKQHKAAVEAQLDRERQWNAANGGLYETHAERAKREYEAQQAQRAQEAVVRQQKIDEMNAQNQQRQAQTDAARVGYEGQRVGIEGERLQIDREKAAREAKKPEFLSQANETNKYITKYNPETGQIENVENPNYNEAKQKAEELRQLLAAQLQAGRLDLDTAKQRYEQWFETNVKTPLALAQEARAKAEAQRQALDAEERRRQFAASFSLQKGELGQRAGAAAMQAEQSLLPYRAGPDEAADMSSAINSLGAGGSMSTNASAGINFKASDFEFNAPDFKSIARNAAKDALKGISSYVPSDEKYATPDYSGVPAVNTSGAPDSTSTGSSPYQANLDSLQRMYQYGGN